jgi:hypothetical protein
LKRNPQALQLNSLWSAAQHIFRNRTFQAYSALSTVSFAGLFTFLATSSFVFTQSMGLSQTVYGLLMISMSASYILGTFICRWLLLRISVQTCVFMASLVSLLAGALMMLVAYAGPGQSWFGAWVVMLPVNIFLLAHGVHQPCGQSGCVAPFPEMAGTASALNGFSMMLVAFGQQKMFSRPIPAILHLFLYAAFIITQIELLEIIFDGAAGSHRAFRESLGGFYTFMVSFIEILSVLAFIGTIAFLARRNLLKVPRLVKSELNGWPKLDANIILISEIILICFIFMMNHLM